MMTTPAIWLSSCSWACRAWPSADAVASRAANTTVKPATKSRVARTRRRWSGRAAEASSALLTPDIIDR